MKRSIVFGCHLLIRIDLAIVEHHQQKIKCLTTTYQRRWLPNWSWWRPIIWLEWNKYGHWFIFDLFAFWLIVSKPIINNKVETRQDVPFESNPCVNSCPITCENGKENTWLNNVISYFKQVLSRHHKCRRCHVLRCLNCTTYTTRHNEMISRAFVVKHEFIWRQQL